ncbi:MAG: hypothetical protein ACRC3H_12975 [Lachnospiraceae bacterium]
MVSFIELAEILPAGEGLIVPVNGTLVFDTIVSSDGTAISYNTGTGVITFNVASLYYIDWYVAPQFGLTVDGSNWAIRTSISGLTIKGSSHTKVSVTTGFGIINAVAGETAQLVNVSSGALTLSQAVQSKAALVVYNTISI